MTITPHRAPAVSTGDTQIRACVPGRVKPSLIIAAVLSLLSPHVYGASVTKPDVKLNPDPRMSYEITVKVENAPGSFDHVEGSVDYKVANPECVPLTPMVGATLVPEKRVAMRLMPVGNNVYKAHVLADLIHDEDYYRKGVCHWTVVGANADFSHDIIDFSPAIFKEDIIRGGSVKKYFSNESYTELDMKRVDIGEDSPDRYANQGAVFSITIESRETSNTSTIETHSSKGQNR